MVARAHLEEIPGHTWREHSWSPCDHTDPSTGPTSRLGFWPDRPAVDLAFSLLQPGAARPVQPPPPLGPVPSPELLPLLRHGVTRLHSALWLLSPSRAWTRVGGRGLGRGAWGCAEQGPQPPSRLLDSWPATPPGALRSRRLRGAGSALSRTTRAPRWPPLRVPPRVPSSPYLWCRGRTRSFTSFIPGGARVAPWLEGPSGALSAGRGLRVARPGPAVGSPLGASRATLAPPRACALAPESPLTAGHDGLTGAPPLPPRRRTSSSRLLRPQARPGP